MNRIIRAFAAFIVSICLILAPPMAYASTSAGGWTALDTITAGATNTINATKTAGGKVLKSAITIAPQAGKVGKHLLRGGAVGALALAIPQLLGDGVDWVLDPANNSIKYTVAGTGTGENDLTGNVPAGVIRNYTVQKGTDDVWRGNKQTEGATANEACADYDYSVTTYNYAGVVHLTATTADCMIIPKSMGAGAGDGAGDPVTKYLPIDNVAAKVISNAAAGHAPSQEAVKAAALEGFAAGEHDAALDASAIPDTGVENPPDTDNPPATDPAVPFDDSSILAAIASLKAVVAGLLSSVGSIGDTLTQFYDWATADPQLEEPEEFKPEIGDPTKYDTVDLNQGYVTASGQCPSAVDLSLNFGVVKLSYEPLCIILDKLSGVIVAVAYISVGFMIIRTV